METCKDCGVEFEPYKFHEDCYNCDDGSVEMEMEWEYTPSIHRCSHCGGTGSISYIVKTRCKGCHQHYIYEEDF